MSVACIALRCLYRPGQGWTGYHQPGPLRDPNTEWADRSSQVGRYPATELMAERNPDPIVGDLRDDDLEGRDWERVRPRRISDADWRCFEGAMSEILHALGMSLTHPGAAQKPCRYLRAMFDSTEGYEGDAKLVTAFPTECYGGPDCERSQGGRGPLPFHALFEHHAFSLFRPAFLGSTAPEHTLFPSNITPLWRISARRWTLLE